jgi:alanyl-tRNA synthetase
MTERLYYSNPSLVSFDARVVERLQWQGVPAVVLDRTAFYPTGGGQPHDTGLLDDVLVVDVVERERDGAVLHLLAEPLASEAVVGRVDWARRFDLMQQHTGQHILSAAFLQHLGANTVGFHLSGEYSTIDLDRAPLSAADLAKVEVLANSIVFEDRPVKARFVPDDEVPSISLRKPLAHRGPVRIVQVPGFDSSACGGTHVGATGQVGLIKVTRSERRGTETRVEFLCGDRALSDYAAKNTMVMDLAQEFTIGHWDLAAMVHRLANDLKETRRELGRMRDALLDAEASLLWQQAAFLQPHTGQSEGQLRVVPTQFADRTTDDLKHLAQRLVAHPATVALLAAKGKADENCYFTFARSDDLDVHMGDLVRQACEVVGGKGGGRPNFAQGGGPQSDKVAQALDMALQALADSISHRDAH